MKQYPLRKDIEVIAICECGHADCNHYLTFFDCWKPNMVYSGQCEICTCPKFKKEKTLKKSDWLEQTKEQKK